MPIYFGMNQSGMQAGDEMPMVDQKWCIKAIEDLREYTLNVVKGLANRKAHKQLFNRYLESFQMMKVLVTSTDFDNFLHLRNHEAADPLIQEVAKCISELLEISAPQILQPGEYHLPYVDVNRYEDMNNIQCFSIHIGGGVMQGISIEDAIKVSGARCAAISYRNTDYGLEKCQQVYGRLINGDRIHASAVEHPCQVMQPQQNVRWSEINPSLNMPDVNVRFIPSTWEEGISHMDRDGNLWSGNFKGFIQHRKIIKNECYKKV
jgi:hypothetical protein